MTAALHQAGRCLAIPLVVLVAMAGALSCSSDDGPPRVAAKVAGAEVTSERVEQLTTQWAEHTQEQATAAGQEAPTDRKEAAKVVLGFMIRSQFLQHLAAQMGIKDNPSAVEAVAPGEVPATEFQAAGWSRADLEQSLRDARLAKAIGEKVFPEVAVSEVELRQKYERSQDLFKQTWRSQVRLAYFDTEEPAGQLAARKVGGDAFDAAARELGARQAGGLEVTPISPLPQPILDVIAGLQAGQVSAPIPGSSGYLVVVADSREDTAALTFDEAREELTKVLKDEQRQRLFFDWFNKQLSQAEVEIAGHYGKWDRSSQLVT